MKGLLCIAASALLALVAGCGSSNLFRSFDLPESPDVAAAPWPRLVDTPAAPPVGSPGIPDPAIGMAVAADLAEAARAAEARAKELDGPVLSEADRARLPQAALKRE